MPDSPLPLTPVPLSTVSLRLAGEVGQATLDWLGARGATGTADLDQHIAAVRAGLTATRRMSTIAARRAGMTAALASRAASERSASAHRSLRPATAARALSEPSCPDVPFASDAMNAEPVLPLRLLLHYACGFIEAAVGADWWPVENAPALPDWEAMRLAAVCYLVAHAEAAAQTHPDLRSNA